MPILIDLRPLSRVRGRPGRAGPTGAVGLARARGPAAGAVRLLCDEPEPARTAPVDLLGRCWTRFFRAEWESSAPALRRAADTGTRRVARDGWSARLRELSPAVRVEPGRHVVDKVQSKRVSAAAVGWC